ncbi:MAG: M48 family metallopeptidase [Bacteroidales bacterium]|nr:M48 family metallopeptidase [Bacteroidales bacterium]
MRKLAIAIALCFSLFAFGQTDYIPIQSKGQIPNEFLSTAKIEYKKDKENIQSRKLLDKQAESDFYLRHNFFINDLFKNGYVLFGDEVSDYVNALGQKILSQVPDLMEGREVKFFVLRNQSVNAFSSQKGYFFINMGLIAQCENEAQLAFVMTHELVHYLKNHAVEGFVESRRIVRKAQERKLSYSRSIELMAEYSQDNEFEADKYGLLEIYLKLGYDIEEVLEVFDVLLYSYLPFDESEFDTAYFNDSYFEMGKNIVERDVNNIAAIEDYDDRLSTHPNIKKRRKQIYDLISSLDDEPNGVEYIVSKEGFEKSQYIARFELCQMYLDDMDYANAFYSAYILSKTNPDNKYLLRIKAYSLYALSKYFNRMKEVKELEQTDNRINRRYVDHESNIMLWINKMFQDLDSLEGNISQFSSMIRKMNRKELNIIAVREIFKAIEVDTSSNYLKLLAKSSIKDLIEINELALNTFLEQPRSDSIDETVFKKLSDEEYNALSKYQKIIYNKDKEKFTETRSTGSYYATAFVQFFMKDKIYKEIYQEVAKESEKELANLELNKKKELSGFGYSTYVYSNFESKNQFKSFVVINPNYSQYNYYNNDNFIGGEKGEIDLIACIKEVTKAANVRNLIFDAYDFKNQNVDYFNDLATSTRFYIEFLRHDYLLGGENILSSNMQFMEKLANIYETDYFAIVNVEDNCGLLVERMFLFGLHAMIDFLYFPYTLPFSVYKLAISNCDSEYIFEVVNIKTGKVVYFNNLNLKTKSSVFLTKNFLYSILWEVNNPNLENKK